MSEEKKENLTPDTEEESLKKELEELKDTFQTAYNETVQEEQSAPVIQELEEEVVEEEEEEEEAQENSKPYPYAHAKANKKNKKEEKKKRSKLPIIIPLILCLFIILPLGVYFIMTLAVPDFSNLMSCVVAAESSKEPADAIESYTDALEYCDGNEFFKAYAQIIHEKIVLLTYEDTGFADAYSYMSQNLTEDQIASPATGELKAFLKVIDEVDEISDKSYDAVKEAIGDSDAEPDYIAILDELKVPESLITDVTTALKSLATAIIAEKTAETRDEMKEVATSYMSAYQTFASLGAKAQYLLEVMALTMYDNGFIYEAKYIIGDYLTEEMLASPKHEELTAAVEDIETIKTYTDSIYDIALKASEDGKTGEDDLSAYIDTDLSEKIQPALVSILEYCLKAVIAEKENNLTMANTNYASAAELCATFELSQPELTCKSIEILYTIGDIYSANTYATENLTEDDIEQADSDFKALYEEITLVYAAMDAANEAFYPYYYSYSSAGTAIDKDAAFADLDKLTTESSNKYDKAFVDYYKYLIEGFTDADSAKMNEYITAFAEAMPEAKFIYGYGLIDNYIAEKENKKALALAKELLEVNIADDYCNMIVALEQRKAGDLKAALETAVSCVENSGEYVYSAREAVILYMLEGNFEKAYEYATILYEESFTIETCELMYVLATEYLKEAEDNEALKEELEYTIEYIDYVYSSYSVSHTDTTKALINGELSLKDVFLSEKYDYDLV